MIKMLKKTILTAVLMCFLFASFAYLQPRAKVSLETFAAIATTKKDTTEHKTSHKNADKHLQSIPVNIDVNGKSYTAYTTAQTVSALLKDQNIKVDSSDYVNVSLKSNIHPYQYIIIKHYKAITKKINIPISFSTIYIKNRLLEKGKVVMLRKGRDGILEKEFRVVYLAGKKVSNKLIRETVVKPAVSQEYTVGEATFNGEYLKKFTMLATAYSPRVSETDTNPWVTATGMRSSIGVIAVDPKVIPLGSLLYVKGYGYAVAGDTGGAIKDNRIDVFFYSTEDALKWGRRTVTVYLLPGKWKFPSKLNY